MPKQEKVKYFNFLLENEINFTRDETGHYVALVKVLNPQFFGEKEKKNESANDFLKVEEKAVQKPRSSSQVVSNRGKTAQSTRTKSPLIKKNSMDKVQTEKKTVKLPLTI